jgi:hypothetical protein
MEYSFLKPISNLTFGEMKEFTIEHYTELIENSNNPKQIIFLTKQIENLLK